MKNILIFALALLTLNSCAKKLGMAQSVLPENEKIVKNDFSDFLKSKSPLSVVLRVPNTAGNVTQKDSGADPNSYYAIIEKRLMANGFEVKDRALLNSLLVGGVTDYEQISQKTKADVIIDITSLNYIKRNADITWEKEEKVPSAFSNFPLVIARATDMKRISIEAAVIDFRLIWIDKGEPGAMMTCYFGNQEPHKFYYYPNRASDKFRWEGEKFNSYSLNLILDKNETIYAFSEYLIDLLRGNFN